MFNRIVSKLITIKCQSNFCLRSLRSERGEFGMSSIIGIAIGLIIAAFILIPGIQTFATKIMSDMQLWWTNSISSQIFPN